MGVSIIIPAYNEENSVGKTIEEIRKAVDKHNGAYELIVVNDGSTDKTGERVRESHAKLIEHPVNRGYGASLKTGVKKATYNLIVITDADGTYPNDCIPELVEISKEGDFDMVVGARVGKNVKVPMIRKPAKWFITKLASYLTDTKIPDLNSGLRIIKKEAIEKFIHILPDGFSFTSTITLGMLTSGHSVKYEPIDYFKREGKSKIKPIQDTLNFIQLIIRTVLYFNPLKVFVPLSLFLVLFAFIVLFGSWFLLGRAMDVTFGVILMTAVIVMVIGLLADLIDKRMRD